MARYVDGYGGDGHGPRLWVDPLKEGGLHEIHRLAGACWPTVKSAGRCRYLPGKIEKIDNTDCPKRLMQRGHRFEQSRHTDADQQDHNGEPTGNTEHVGQGADEAESDARCQQHQIVGAWRYRGDQTKPRQRHDDVHVKHGASLIRFLLNGVAFNAQNDLFLQ